MKRTLWMAVLVMCVQCTAETERIRMVVTGYCPCELCCGEGANGITASGKPVSYNGGRFAAADRSIPFGTRVSVPGYGVVPVIDRGGAIKGRRLDLFFSTHKQALKWGRRTIMVRVMK